MKLLARTKRLQDEIPLLREECDKLLAAKQVNFRTQYLFMLLVVSVIPLNSNKSYTLWEFLVTFFLAQENVSYGSHRIG